LAIEQDMQILDFKLNPFEHSMQTPVFVLQFLQFVGQFFTQYPFVMVDPLLHAKHREVVELQK
jgi:hypothetical protein